MRNICRRPSYLPDRKMWVDCGHCYACRLKKRGEWIMRLEHEFFDKKHDALFVTLTYENRWLPVSKTGTPTLLKRDVQKWLKRFRKAIDKDFSPAPRFRYFICGEYGSLTQRPHYHAILIGLDMRFEPYIKLTWAMCHPTIGYDVKPINSKAAIAYVTGYTGKKIGVHYGKRCIDTYGRSPEFQLTSSHIGLGYLEKLSAEDPRIKDEGKIYNCGKAQYLPRTYRRQLGLEGSELYKNDIRADQNAIVGFMKKYYGSEVGMIVKDVGDYDGRYRFGDYLVTDRFYETLKKVRDYSDYNLQQKFSRSKRNIPERSKL